MKIQLMRCRPKYNKRSDKVRSGGLSRDALPINFPTSRDRQQPIFIRENNAITVQIELDVHVMNAINKMEIGAQLTSVP